MSVSGIGDSSVSSLFASQMNQMKRPEDFESTEDFVDSVLNDQDSDGDGLLSASESQFSADQFNQIDTDNDGNLSADELKADIERMQEMKSALGSMSVAMSKPSSGGSSESSSSEEADQEYDEYDYNQDGVVTADELQQAYANGATSLEDIVGRRGDMDQKQSAEESQSGQSVFQRMAMRAYSEQAANTSTSNLLGANV